MVLPVQILNRTIHTKIFLKVKKMETKERSLKSTVVFWLITGACWILIVYLYMIMPMSHPIKTLHTLALFSCLCLMLVAVILFALKKSLPTAIVFTCIFCMAIVMAYKELLPKDTLIFITIYVLCLLACALFSKSVHKRKIIFFLEILLVVALLIFNTTVVGPSIIFTQSAVRYLDKTTFLVSPYIFMKLPETAPSLEGTIPVKEIPENWTVTVSYKVLNVPAMEKDARPLLKLKTVLENGVIIPAEIYTMEGNPKEVIEMYLQSEFMFLKTKVRVTHSTLRVWE